MDTLRIEYLRKVKNWSLSWYCSNKKFINNLFVNASMNVLALHCNCMVRSTSIIRNLVSFHYLESSATLGLALGNSSMLKNESILKPQIAIESQ